MGGIVLSNIPTYAAIHIETVPMEGSGVPWYFIYQDLWVGLGAFIGLILGVSLSIATRKKYPFSSHMNLWMVLLWQAPKAALAAYIFIRCQNLLDPAHAVAPWANFDEYFHDWMKSWGIFVCMLVPLLIALFPQKPKTDNSDSQPGQDQLILD